MATAAKPRRRARGEIETLPSGSLRVRVYAGIDPVSKKKHYLVETIPAGPKAEKLAEQARTRLLAQVDERRNPRTNATVNQLIERHLDLLDKSPSWLSTCRTYHRLHISPLIGHVKAGDLDADILDSFYAELRRCRAHCGRRSYVEHRTTREHLCDEHDNKPCSPPDPECRACRRRCRPHNCRPLGATTIRQIHFLLRGAYKRAVRWKWVQVNPIIDADPPAPPPPNPHPTTVDETARIINEAWSDPDWGALIWLAVACGGRRAELCALQWREVDLDRAVIALKRAVARDGQGRWYLKDTKSHQQRRVALDPLTVSVVTAQWERYKERCAALGMSARDDAFVFSLAPDHSTFLIPESVSQRFGRLVARMGIDTSIHALRHYNATELIAAGVDPRTVAGRLGHGGGGVTTLRIYSAFLEEFDQRAAVALSPRMPELPGPQLDPVERAKTNPRSPYERIAAALRVRILSGELPEGSHLPSIVEIAESNGVAVGTAHRAVALLKTWGLVEVASGSRTVIAAPPARNNSGPT